MNKSILTAACAAGLLTMTVAAQDQMNDSGLNSRNAAVTNDVSRTTGTNSFNAADNTGRNVRDRDGRMPTPLDQGNNASDVNITKQIRQEIIAAKDLSVNAHNVKVITNNGRVTLRGPVNTADEKRVISEIANRVAQGGNVDNQLEVKNQSNND